MVLVLKVQTLLGCILIVEVLKMFNMAFIYQLWAWHPLTNTRGRIQEPLVMFNVHFLKHGGFWGVEV
jgi:hypothetical protein